MRDERLILRDDRMKRISVAMRRLMDAVEEHARKHQEASAETSDLRACRSCSTVTAPPVSR